MYDLRNQRAHQTNARLIAVCEGHRAQIVAALDAGHLKNAQVCYQQYQAAWDYQQTHKAAWATLNALGTRSSYSRAAALFPNAIAPMAALGAYVARKRGTARTQARSMARLLTGRHFDPPSHYDPQGITDQIVRLLHRRGRNR